ncbi:D-isomer-specific 2-hydroxyacid dehydrogenase-like protein [Geopyxis carbonaria]|nr:D-isomer-specific 2-hydroxyacid dehydrogenase-like protein [Geopyxis carbonaria]
MGNTETVAAQLEEHVVVTMPFPESVTAGALDKLRAAYPKSTFTWVQVQMKLSDSSAGMDDPEIPWEKCTILFSVFSFPEPAQVPNLKFIQLASAGVDFCAKSALYQETDIPIASATGIHGPQITEHVFATLLALTHNVPTLLSWQRESRWGSRPGQHMSVQDLVGKTLGVLGYGSIGRQAARVAKALGMKVLAYTASEKSTPESRRDNGYIVPGTGDASGEIPDEWFHGLDEDSRRNFLKQGIDVLLVAVPLTPQTKHFLAEEEFEILGRPRHNSGKGAYVVNIARGGIIDHDALIRALKKGLDPKVDGGLAGASLDVTEPEPLPSDSELWGLENVIITPHVSGNGDNYFARALEIMAINLERIRNDEKFLNLVNRSKGY